MVDAERLMKAIDKVTWLPTDTGVLERGEADAVWYQGDWVIGWSERGREGKLHYEYDAEGKETSERRPVMITEQGVVNALGMKCGTACCLAGQIVIDNAPVGTEIVGERVKLPDGRFTSVPKLSDDLVGLDGHKTVDGDDLYHWSNSPADLVRIAKRLIAEQQGF